MSLLHLKETLKVRGDLHHAYLLTGNREIVTKALFEFLSKDLNFSTKGNPDLHHYEYESLGIDDGKMLQSYAIQKALGEYKIFVASFGTITREAQNALLKLFEDPKERTHFFLIAETEEVLIPTLRSRLLVLDMTETASLDGAKKKAKDFLAFTKTERLSSLKDFLEEKNKQIIYNFLGALEVVLYEKSKEKGEREGALKGLAEVTRSKQYIFDRSASLKLLLEHVAVSVPRI
jgi:DNA polymerase III delta prime subunit